MWLRLKWQGYHEMRLDRYRIVYCVDDDLLMVVVVSAGKESTGFYDDLPWHRRTRPA